MKRTIKVRLVVMIATMFMVRLVNAQAPQAIPYQAAARNSAGIVLQNKTIGLRFTVHDATATGTVVYKETQNAVTNAIGMFIVNIGQGTALTGTFSAINWGSGGKFMQVEFDSTATGSRYLDLGTQQLMSVPYALSALKSDNGVPIGTIEAFAGDANKIPIGWALCDGNAHDTSDLVWKNLYNIIGFAWGYANNKAQFKLPYTNGLFLRGIDNGQGNDPDAASRLAIGSNIWFGNVGDAVGSLQTEAFKSHNHALRLEYGTGSNLNSTPGGSYSQITSTQAYGYNGNGTNVSFVGGSETRPKNVYVNYIIKY